MYLYDVETFMCACDRKGLAAKTMKSYEQTLRLFGLFLAERGITQTEEIRHPHIEAYIDTVRSRGKYTVCSVQEPSSPNYPERRKDYGKKVSPVTINKPWQTITNYQGNLLIAFTAGDEEILSQDTIDGTLEAAHARKMNFVNLYGQFYDATHNCTGVEGADDEAVRNRIEAQTAQFFRQTLLWGAL